MQVHQHMFCARLDMAVDDAEGGKGLAVSEVWLVLYTSLIACMSTHERAGAFFLQSIVPRGIRQLSNDGRSKIRLSNFRQLYIQGSPSRSEMAREV